jgi:hypothetical protein
MGEVNSPVLSRLPNCQAHRTPAVDVKSSYYSKRSSSEVQTPDRNGSRTRGSGPQVLPSVL